MEPALSSLPAWRAKLRFVLRERAGRTRVVTQEHDGPLALQRAFHPETDGTAHVVVLHPPGGLVGGDRLVVDAKVESGRAVLTTPGASKVYRSLGAESRQTTELQVAAGAHLEHVPQETVAFEGARAAIATTVRLEGNAQFLGWEVVCLGRPAADEAFARGAIRLALEVWRSDRLLFVERGRIDGGSPAIDAAWGNRGEPAFGTLVATGATDSLDVIRDELPPQAAATLVSGLLVVRALGYDGLHVRRILERARHRVRRAWGRSAIDPAIWRS